MTNAGVSVQEQVMMYKAVVCTVFLYVDKIRVLMGAMLMVIKGFYHQVAKQLSGNTNWCAMGGSLLWTLM